MTNTNGKKHRVLVVEDEMLIAFEIEEALAALDCEVVGPVSTLARAHEAVDAPDGFDGAVLDITVRGGKIFPVAARLQELGIPFVFASGHDEAVVPEELRGHGRLVKPFTTRELEDQLRLLTVEIEDRVS